jgi:selenocysteine lyase/cysteine desulfurase
LSTQSTCFRHEARQIVAEAVNAKITGRGAEDVVIFTGSGSTSAINKMVKVLGLDVPLGDIPSHQRPVVFVGPFEHHSNLLPWRESSADVVMIGENSNGGVDLRELVAKLKEYAPRPLKIGSFSAASNVTGRLAEVDQITVLMRSCAHTLMHSCTPALMHSYV